MVTLSYSSRWDLHITLTIMIFILIRSDLKVHLLSLYDHYYKHWHIGNYKSGNLVNLQTESNYPNIIADLASSTIYIDRASLNGGHYSVDNFGHIITLGICPVGREIGYYVDRIRKLEITQGTSYQNEHTNSIHILDTIIIIA